MTAVLTRDRGLALFERVVEDQFSSRAPRGRVTLDDLIVGIWEDVAAHRDAGCPLCGAAMAPRYGAGLVPVGGRCHDCGTTLD
jgi:hypothetical protein